MLSTNCGCGFFVLFLFGEVDMRVGPASSAASPLYEAEPQSSSHQMGRCRRLDKKE